MKHRSELPNIYIMFARMFQTQFSKPIKVLRADNAMDTKSHPFSLFFNLKVPSLSTPVPARLLEMVVPNENISTYLIQSVLY